MKRSIYALLMSTLVMLCMPGCEKARFITLPEHTPRLVVHGYEETGELFRVYVGRSFRADIVTNVDSSYISNATVVVYENGILKDTLDYVIAESRYASTTLRPVSGNIYRIVVSAPGFETAEASVTAPFPVPTTAFHYVRGTRVNVSGEIMDDVVFRFNDPPGVENYYHARLQMSGPHGGTFCVYTYDPAVERYQSDVNPFESGSCIFSDELQFTDRFFDGQTKEISLSAPSNALAERFDPFTGVTYRSYLKRYNISKDLYRYMKAEIMLGLSSNDPFGQPVSIQGNIQNGYGVFGIMAGVADTLR